MNSQPETPAGTASHVWYTAVFSRDQIAAGALATISQRFADVVNAAGAPDGACLFATIAEPRGGDPAGDRTSGRVVYFSPASVSAVPQLIVLAKARPGPPPERWQVELLVGNPQDWDLLPRSTH